MHFFLILQLCLAPFFNFFPLSDLNIIYSKFLEKSNFFGKISDISDFLPFSLFFTDFFSSDFFLSKSFPCHPKTDFSPKNRPKNPIFCSLLIAVCLIWPEFFGSTGVISFITIAHSCPFHLELTQTTFHFNGVLSSVF